MEKYLKSEIINEQVTESLVTHYSEILSLLGEDNQREGLIKTPERVGKALQFITQGYKIDPDEILKSALFNENHSEMVIVKDIELFSMCEHHMLPFLGVAVVIEAKHLCMMMRGVQKQNSITTTSAFTGEFEKPATRSEFLKLIASSLS